MVTVAVATTDTATGVRAASAAAATEGTSNVVLLARSLFGQYVYAFELTSVLLVIAVVGAVVLARRQPRHEDEEAVEDH